MMEKINTCNAQCVLESQNTLSASLKRVDTKIMEYYRNLPEDKLVLPSNSSWRQYRLHVGDFWASIHDRITTSAKLKNLLVVRPIYGVYATIGNWLNPSILKKISHHGRLIEKSVRRNPLLKSDYVIDIDMDFVADKQYTVDCYNFLEQMGYKKMGITYTGHGSQIVIPDFYIPTIADPVKRLLKCREEFIDLTNLLLDNMFPVDKGVMEDWPTRVVKLIPNTLSRHGTIVERVDINKIYDFQPKQIFEPVVKMKYPVKVISVKKIYYE
jgi:hypothetical protein